MVQRLIINGIELPFASHEITQTFERFGGFSAQPRRFASGGALTQHRWERVRTTISGTGWVPPGLAAVDWVAPVTIAWVAHRSIQSASRVIALPAARRTDAAPYGFGVTAGGLLVPTSVESLAGNTLTLADVAGAAAYVACYWPLLSMSAPAGVVERFESAGLVIGWQIDAEEV